MFWKEKPSVINVSGLIEFLQNEPVIAVSRHDSTLDMDWHSVYRLCYADGDIAAVRRDYASRAGDWSFHADFRVARVTLEYDKHLNQKDTSTLLRLIQDKHVAFEEMRLQSQLDRAFKPS